MHLAIRFHAFKRFDVASTCLYQSRTQKMPGGILALAAGPM
jgi:hypothetical protein